MDRHQVMKDEEIRNKLEKQTGERISDAHWFKLIQFVENQKVLEKLAQSTYQKYEISWFIFERNFLKQKIGLLSNSPFKSRIQLLLQRWVKTKKGKINGSEILLTFKEITGIQPTKTTLIRWCKEENLIFSQRREYTTKELLPVAQRMFLYTIRETTLTRIKLQSKKPDNYPFETINTKGESS